MASDLGKKVTMVEMEKKLHADKTGQYKKSILNALDLCEGDASKKITFGLDKETFDALNFWKKAIINSKRVIGKF